jgi:hypothetical protein
MYRKHPRRKKQIVATQRSTRAALFAIVQEPFKRPLLCVTMTGNGTSSLRHGE